MGDISKHFDESEIACKCGCGFSSMHPDTLEPADFVRDLVGYSITPSSGCRCPIHNRNEGSDDGSQHPKARAMDLPIRPEDLRRVYDALCARYPDSHGFILYFNAKKGISFIHIDSRKIKYRKLNID